MKLFYLFELCTYLALLPIVFKALMCVDYSKIFKKNNVQEIRLLYLILTIAITKLVGDFFIEIMAYIRLLFGLKI